jgi:hypothetical protein
MKNIGHLASLLIASALIAGITTPTYATPIYLAPLAIADTASGANMSSVPSTSSSSSSNAFMFGPSFGVFFPTSSKTSKTYGQTWTSIGLGLGSAVQANTRGSLSPYFDILYNAHDSNTALLVPLGISYRKALVSDSTAPYYGLQAYALGVDQDAPKYNVHYGLSIGAGARAAIGLQFSNYAFIEAAYMEDSTVKSFDFSGTQIVVGIRF